MTGGFRPLIPTQVKMWLLSKSKKLYRWYTSSTVVAS
jgi:hypothetical protein